MTLSTTPQSSFAIKRLLPGNPNHIYRFWSDPDLKRRWTDCHPDWSELERTADFRVGGHDRQRLRAPGGLVQRVDTHYLDLQPARRLVYAYSMHHDDAPLSASLVTIDLLPEGASTRMLFTEHLALLDGSSDVSERQVGTNEVIDKLVALLETA